MTVADHGFSISTAGVAEREEIYRLRHAVYARELHQHGENVAQRLSDALDGHNHYVCARRNGTLVGFVSITPPGCAYSVDKYVPRASLPFTCDERLFEVRILTVHPEARGSAAAVLLMYAALRWVEAHGGTRIVAIGRHEALGLYRKVGFTGTGIHIESGRVRFE